MVGVVFEVQPGETVDPANLIVPRLAYLPRGESAGLHGAVVERAPLRDFVRVAGNDVVGVREIAVGVDRGDILGGGIKRLPAVKMLVMLVHDDIREEAAALA